MILTVTIANAAARLQTNSAVIHQWIKQGRIPTLETDRGMEIPLTPFEAICHDLETWMQGELEADEDGSLRITITQLEQFWQQREQDQGRPQQQKG